MQHRAYQPVLPCGNKYLQQKWDITCYKEHRRKVKSAQPMVNTTSPQAYGHLHVKMKKLKLEEERLSVIQRDNDMLLGKMSYIMRTTGRIDNRNDYEYKSLSREKRQQELLRVTKENQVILERISHCGSRYSVERWREDWRRTEKYMERIAHYPRRQSPACNRKIKAMSSRNKTKKNEGKEKDKEDQRACVPGSHQPNKGSERKEKTETEERESSSGAETYEDTREETEQTTEQGDAHKE
nr:PREDICTED: uncharacterized protein C17orf105 homolog [Lepisosteus oculatus]